MPPEATDPNQPAPGEPQEPLDDAHDAGDGAGEDDRPIARPEPADDDDDDDADDYEALPFKEDPQFKRVLTKLKKRNRQLAKLRPLAARVKDVDLDSVLTKAKSADELQATLARHPELAEQVLKAMSGLAERPPAAAAKKFDRKSLPFSVEDPSGQFFATFYEEFLAMKEELASTKSALATHRDSADRQSRAVEMRGWQDAVKAAASKVPTWARDMFNDAVYGAYREAQSRGNRLDPQRVIRHYLNNLPIGDQAKAAANAAAKDRIASTNTNLPRVPSRSGVPASARKPGETVADVNRRVRSGAYTR